MQHDDQSIFLLSLPSVHELRLHLQARLSRPRRSYDIPVSLACDGASVLTAVRPFLGDHRMGVLDIVPAGVVSGKDVYKVFDYARENKFAIPAFNVTVSLHF